MKCYPVARFVGFFVLLVASGTAALGEHVPNPAVTASARAFSAGFPAANLFDAGVAEYATASQGAVSVPFTTDPNNGTWAQFDFGATVTFDRFVMVARLNAVDVIGTSRLIVSADPAFDSSDTIFTFNPSGSNGAGLIHYLGPTSGRYVRWEVLTRTGTGVNLGARQMYFVNTPTGQVLLPSPVVINSSTPFNATFAASQAANGNAGDSSGNEFASAGVGATMFVDFDFTASVPISGFDHWNRPVDRVTTFDLIFADTPDFAAPIATHSFTASANGNQINSATFATVQARYVRFQATGATGGNNTGIREIQFYTPAGQRPFITQQPQNATRLAGDAVTFSVTAGGESPITYQWRRALADIPGATGSLLTLTNLQLGDDDSFDVVIANNNGSVTSTLATLTVVDPPLDIASDIQLWLTLDDGTFLSAGDSSPNANHGTLQGFFDDDTQWTAGRLNGALQYRPSGAGVNEVVTVPDISGLNFDANPEFTISVWVRGTPQQEDGAGIVTRGGGGGGEQYALDVFGGAYRLFVRSPGGLSVLNTPARPDGTWQHVVAVYSRTLGRMKLYVNKSEVASGAPLATTLLPNQHEISVGARQSATNEYNLNFSGILDDVRIYSRPMTPRDVAALYDEAPPQVPGIVREPQNAFAAVGGSATFLVIADGTVPLSYRWFKGGTIIPDATNATLTVTNAQLADDDDYRVEVSNDHGDDLSNPAHLSVIQFLNLAAAPAQASSLFNATFPAAGAFDGLRQSTGPNTARWASAASGAPHWLLVDLGSDLLLRRIGLDWETAAGRDFTLRVRTSAEGFSANPDDYATVANVSGYAHAGQGVDGVDVFFDFLRAEILMPGNIAPTATTGINSAPVNARYLMLHSTAITGTFQHVSVWELQVDALDLRARITSFAADADSARLTFSGAVGSSYEIRRATVVTGPYTNLTTLPVPAIGVIDYTDPDPPQPNGFYQIVLP